MKKATSYRLIVDFDNWLPPEYVKQHPQIIVLYSEKLPKALERCNSNDRFLYLGTGAKSGATFIRSVQRLQHWLGPLSKANSQIQYLYTGCIGTGYSLLIQDTIAYGGRTMDQEAAYAESHRNYIYHLFVEIIHFKNIYTWYDAYSYRRGSTGLSRLCEMRVFRRRRFSNQQNAAEDTVDFIKERIAHQTDPIVISDFDAHEFHGEFEKVCKGYFPSAQLHHTIAVPSNDCFSAEREDRNSDHYLSIAFAAHSKYLLS